MKAWFRSTLFYCIGVVISTLCAIVLANLYTGTDWKIEGPVLFAITLVILASHFGAIISVPGAFAGAAVFAFFLYNPENSFRVNSEAERSTLAWMILTSIALSYLLYPTQKVRAVLAAREQERLAGNAPQTGSEQRIHHRLELLSALASEDESPRQQANEALAGGAFDTGCEVGNGRSGGDGRG